MPRLIRLAPVGTVAAVALASVTLAVPATAKPTQTATLQCGSQNYTVDGFGRGQVLHVTGTNRNFVVTRAVREGGAVVFDSRARADRVLVTCITRTPEPDSVGFTFTGFFTPAR